MKTEMTIALPEIEKAGCRSFTACGRVATKDKSLSKFFADKRTLIASIKRGRSQRFVRLCFGQAGHLHVDVATPTYFPEEWKPKPTCTWPRIQALLDRFFGQRIPVRVEGVFSLPVERLPESGFIRMLSVESMLPNVSMKLTGGTFSVTGASIQRIAWSLEREGKRIEVRLRSTVEATLNETYLEELFGLLSESLHVFVLGNERNTIET
ncbi:MAG: hypothetical protein HYY24_06010 [Verrucomicrobia bacterium]|nr:hypothetical protein [Verrucomicrobiota bacterium]